MTSSTSNSKPEASSVDHSEKKVEMTEQQEDCQNAKERRRVGLYALICGGLTIIISMGLVNAGIAGLRYTSLNPFSIQRIQTAADNLDVALSLPEDESREVVFVLGSSLIHFGFSPDQFDDQLNKAGKPTLSYNFGFGNADPSIHLKFARKLARTYAEHPGRVDRVIYEFAPHGATRRRAETTGQLDHATTAVLSDWSDIGETFLNDPEEAFALINTRVFRSGVPAEAITHMLSMPIKVAEIQGAVKDQPEPEPMDNLGWDLFNQLRIDWADSIPFGGWSAEYRGGFPTTASDKAISLSTEVMRRMQDPVRMEATRQQRISCCDMLDLEMDPNMVANVIQTIRYAQSIANDVDIVIMPLNQDIVTISPSGQENFAKALAEVVAATGVDVIDIYKEPYLGLEYFFDVDHYTFFKGRSKVTSMMADKYVMPSADGSQVTDVSVTH